VTQRHLLTVDFKDIKALEVTCKCGGKLTIPVPKDDTRRMLYQH